MYTHTQQQRTHVSNTPCSQLIRLLRAKHTVHACKFDFLEYYRKGETINHTKQYSGPKVYVASYICMRLRVWYIVDALLVGEGYPNS